MRELVVRFAGLTAVAKQGFSAIREIDGVWILCGDLKLHDPSPLAA